MYSRVTLLEIDTLRLDVADGVELFRTEVLPELRAHEGYEGSLVLANPEGKGMIVTVWETEEAAAAAAGFASGVLEEHMALFRAPPGRELYEVAFADLGHVAVG